jgi:hypothetical protein
MGTDWETLVVGVLAFIVMMSWVASWDIRNKD